MLALAFAFSLGSAAAPPGFLSSEDYYVREWAEETYTVLSAQLLQTPEEPEAWQRVDRIRRRCAVGRWYDYQLSAADPARWLSERLMTGRTPLSTRESYLLLFRPSVDYRLADAWGSYCPWQSWTFCIFGREAVWDYPRFLYILRLHQPAPAAIVGCPAYYGDCPP